jgi:hypothetical protein
MKYLSSKGSNKLDSKLIEPQSNYRKGRWVKEEKEG